MEEVNARFSTRHSSTPFKMPTFHFNGSRLHRFVRVVRKLLPALFFFSKHRSTRICYQFCTRESKDRTRPRTRHKSTSYKRGVRALQYPRQIRTFCIIAYNMAPPTGRTVSIYTHPIQSVVILALLFIEASISLLTFAREHLVIIATIAAFPVVCSIIDTSPLTNHPIFLGVSGQTQFIAYWVVLGILSSVGLGSGLHTFVLFLGPHIVRVANTALSTGSTDFSAQINR